MATPAADPKSRSDRGCARLACSPACRIAEWDEALLFEEWQASIPKQYRPWRQPPPTRTGYQSSHPPRDYGVIIGDAPPAEMIAEFLAAFRRAEHRDANKPTLGPDAVRTKWRKLAA